MAEDGLNSGNKVGNKFSGKVFRPGGPILPDEGDTKSAGVEGRRANEEGGGRDGEFEDEIATVPIPPPIPQ